MINVHTVVETFRVEGPIAVSRIVEVFAVTVLGFLAVHLVAGDFREDGFDVSLDFFWWVFFEFCDFLCVFFWIVFCVENVILGLVNADAAEAVFAADAVIAVVYVIAVFAVIAIVAVVAIEAV